MKEYKFGVWLTIEAEDEDSALYAYDQIKKSVWLKDSYCFEWDEVK